MERGEFEPPMTKAEALAIDSEHLLRTENIPFDIDNWYPSLKRWTFETRFIPLSRPQARSIVRHYRARFLGRDAFSPADAKVLQELEDRIDTVIQDSFATVGCFMRLCGRSAKDADPLDRSRVRSEYESSLRDLAPGLAVAEIPSAIRMRAAARTSVLRACTGADVMSQLLTSERVYIDILDWLWYGEPEQIVLRRWESEISLDHEFRLYVYENSLNAISQYDHYCRYDHLFPLRDQLQEKLVALWREVHPHIGVASYAIDLVYLPKSDRVMLVELSPFLRCTGAHCFRWGRPEDVDVLEGRRPFEFRLVERSADHFDEMFANGWDQRWYGEDDPPKYWEFYQSVMQHRAAGLRHFLRQMLRKVHGLHCVMSSLNELSRALLGLVSNPCRKWTPLFVYGTLKRGMHWNSKFLGCGARFMGSACTMDSFPLVVGRCGVPYLLLGERGKGHRVCGELWEVDTDTLEGLDQYEGVGKGYYSRPSLVVVLAGQELVAQVYALTERCKALCQLPHLHEYDSETHRRRYRAVEHVLLKQQIYLQGCCLYSCKALKHPARNVEEDAEGHPQEDVPQVSWADGK